MTNNKNIFFALHLYKRPEREEFWSSLRDASKLLRAKGYTLYFSVVYADPYIQKARNILVSRFLKSNCDTLFFVADDVKYSAEDMLKVIEIHGDLVVGAYRVKTTEVGYPVFIYVKDGQVVMRADGCVSAGMVQTGFMRVHRNVFNEIAACYPELAYYAVRDGKPFDVNHDFFPQGVHDHQWIGEDYAFCRLWTELGGKVWIVPDIDLVHYDSDKGYAGNFHIHLQYSGLGYKE